MSAPEGFTPSICTRSSVFSRRLDSCSPVSHHASCHLLRHHVYWNFDAYLMARKPFCMTDVTRRLLAGMQYAREVLSHVRVGMRTVGFAG